VIQDPGAADNGLFLRDEEGRPLCLDRVSGEAGPAPLAADRVALKGEHRFGGGRKKKERLAVPVFQLLAERYLDPSYAPDAVAPVCGIDARTIRRIAAELAHVAFQREVIVETPWTDAYGETHSFMRGRPVSMHAMRGISAHSNGFHTCRALHLVQMLLGSVDVPGGFRFKPPFPKPIPPAPKPAGKPDQVAAGKPMAGPPLGFPHGPDDLLLDAEGRPVRIDKAFSWDAPLAVHGMMHSVITNAFKRDPYGIDVLMMYMANMAWNSAMNTSGTIEMLTARDPATDRYVIPHIIYSDAYFSETVAYADLVLPDTTYLERWDCISVLDRPISSAEGPADAIRQPVFAPDRDVRPFQDVLLDLGARLGLPGMTAEDGAARYPGGYADYIQHHERTPGVGSLMGFRGSDGTSKGKGEPNSDQLRRYVENGCFWQDEIPPEAHYFKNVNRAYLDYATAMGFIPKAEPIPLQLYSEVLQRFRLAGEGHGAVRPPEMHVERIRTYFDPLPFWYRPFEDEGDAAGFPMHAVTQRPMAMYHSWGSMNAWLRQIHGSNRLNLSRTRAAELGLVDDDWVWVTSRNGRIKAQIRLADGVNDHTCWTWNAIGKRAGAWNLDPDAPEASRGFLLNHLIDELLPERGSGYRYANADPVTGQAAWYDLRVRIEKAEAGAGVSAPQFAVLHPPESLHARPHELRYGAKLKREAAE
jgi:anaerobic selenocysteine-containing dehydrogenase